MESRSALRSSFAQPRLVALLAALLTALVAVLTATTAAASATATAENRVRASNTTVGGFVGQPEHVCAGQHEDSTPIRVVTVVATVVAANNGSTPGWSTGDDPNSLTRAGNKPAWSTIRARFWKNEAADPQIDDWSSANLDRMSVVAVHHSASTKTRAV